MAENHIEAISCQGFPQRSSDFECLINAGKRNQRWVIQVLSVRVQTKITY